MAAPSPSASILSDPAYDVTVTVPTAFLHVYRPNNAVTERYFKYLDTIHPTADMRVPFIVAYFHAAWAKHAKIYAHTAPVVQISHVNGTTFGYPATPSIVGVDGRDGRHPTLMELLRQPNHCWLDFEDFPLMAEPPRAIFIETDAELEYYLSGFRLAAMLMVHPIPTRVRNMSLQLWIDTTMHMFTDAEAPSSPMRISSVSKPNYLRTEPIYKRVEDSVQLSKYVVNGARTGIAYHVPDHEASPLPWMVAAMTGMSLQSGKSVYSTESTAHRYMSYFATNPHGPVYTSVPPFVPRTLASAFMRPYSILVDGGPLEEALGPRQRIAQDPHHYMYAIMPHGYYGGMGTKFGFASRPTDEQQAELAKLKIVHRQHDPSGHAHRMIICGQRAKQTPGIAFYDRLFEFYVHYELPCTVLGRRVGAETDVAPSLSTQLIRHQGVDYLEVADMVLHSPHYTRVQKRRAQIVKEVVELLHECVYE